MKANYLKAATGRNNSSEFDLLQPNPAFCKTQSYFDRDVELLRCEETHNCRYKSYMLGMVICNCPTDDTGLN
ncbi:MAG: hypothetical protein PVG66_01175 [Chromatiales bacterium]|jgi:hypothetical protein